MPNSIEAATTLQPSRFSEVVLRLVFGEGHPTHDEFWESIPSEEAALIREAIVRANQLRAEESDPGDAYLEGVAATLAAERLQNGIVQDDSFIQPVAELPQIPQHNIRGTAPDVSASGAAA